MPNRCENIHALALCDLFLRLHLGLARLGSCAAHPVDPNAPGVTGLVYTGMVPQRPLASWIVTFSSRKRISVRWGVEVWGWFFLPLFSCSASDAEGTANKRCGAFFFLLPSRRCASPALLANLSIQTCRSARGRLSMTMRGMPAARTREATPFTNFFRTLTPQASRACVALP